MPETSVGKGLAAADRYYQEYGLRAKELKAQGQKVIGYLCAFTPAEVITAAGMVPFRIKGDVNEPITKADTEMETIVCPLVRSCFDIALKGHYDFLNGLVIPHACDSICRTYDVWKYSLKLPYAHFINMPHGTGDASLDFYKEVLNTFRTSLGKFAGKEISDGALAEAVKLHNQNRAKVRELYELRKSSPPLISGEELTKVLIAVMGLPVTESIELLDEVIAEARARGGLSAQKPARIMVIGAQVDDIAFIKLIEDSGAWVVADDLCPGAREFLSPVDVTADPIDGLAERYLRKIKCGRTYFEPEGGSYPEYLEQRFGHMGRMVKDFKVDGVVLYIYKYCDPYGFEVPQIKSYIEAKSTPVLYLEDEYSMSTIGRLRTRVQAFLEMLGK
jgi:bzd-type benzoyl-CoA reductase N subunit